MTGWSRTVRQQPLNFKYHKRILSHTMKNVKPLTLDGEGLGAILPDRFYKTVHASHIDKLQLRHEKKILRSHKRRRLREARNSSRLQKHLAHESRAEIMLFSVIAPPQPAQKQSDCVVAVFFALAQHPADYIPDAKVDLVRDGKPHKGAGYVAVAVVISRLQPLVDQAGRDYQPLISSCEAAKGEKTIVICYRGVCEKIPGGKAYRS